MLLFLYSYRLASGCKDTSNLAATSQHAYMDLSWLGLPFELYSDLCDCSLALSFCTDRFGLLHTAFTPVQQITARRRRGTALRAVDAARIAALHAVAAAPNDSAIR